MKKKNIAASYENNKFKILAPTWNDKFELPDGSYSGSDIQYFSEYTIKKYKALTGNPPIRAFVNKTENRITFKIKTITFKTRYDLELPTLETMKLLGSTKNKIAKY